jgi:hypothetical protein
VTTSTETGSGSFIGSLAGSFVSIRSNSGGAQKNQNEKVANPQFRADDLTGDKAVAETLQKAKK